MRKTVGVLVMEHIAVGLVEAHKVLGSLDIFPEKPQSLDPLQSMPAEGVVDCIRQQIEKVAAGEKIGAIGIGFPGIIRNGGRRGFAQPASGQGVCLASGLVRRAKRQALRELRFVCSMTLNVMAAGIAATQGKLNNLIRVWDPWKWRGLRPLPFQRRNLGGRALRRHSGPQRRTSAVVVGADIWKESSDRRSMRLRFLDLEPDEVFENAAPATRAARNLSPTVTAPSLQPLHQHPHGRPRNLFRQPDRK